MRSFDEVGFFADFTEEQNEAYRLYASLYLDYVDDNYQHFFYRDIDTRPIDDFFGVPTPEQVIEAYINAAVSIAKHTGLDRKTLINQYPPLKDHLAAA